MTALITQTFDSAAENMRYDETLMAHVENASTQDIFRFYTWQKKGITQSYNKAWDPQFNTIDFSFRMTGGGAVFHAPGNCVFSWISKQQKGVLQLKKKLTWMMTLIQITLKDLDIETTSQQPDKTALNIQFCQSYPNPYELYYQNNKILGIAIRRFKTIFVMQGVLHCQSNLPLFDLPEAYTAYLTPGLKGIISSDTFISKLRQNIGLHSRAPL